MNIIKKLAVLFTGIILQATILSLLEVKNIKPDLVLVIVIIIALLEGMESGMHYGFIAGLAEDILCGGIIGLNAFIKTIIGFVIGFFKEKLFGTSIITQSIIVFLASIFQGAIVFVVLNVFQFNVTWTNNFVYIIFPGSIYNVVLIIIVFAKIKDWLQPQRLI